MKIFKGNYSVDQVGKTGVYYRHLDNAPAGGNSPVVLIANNTDTLIPGTGKGQVKWRRLRVTAVMQKPY